MCDDKESAHDGLFTYTRRGHTAQLVNGSPPLHPPHAPPPPLRHVDEGRPARLKAGRGRKKRRGSVSAVTESPPSWLLQHMLEVRERVHYLRSQRYIATQEVLPVTRHHPEAHRSTMGSAAPQIAAASTASVPLQLGHIEPERVEPTRSLREHLRILHSDHIRPVPLYMTTLPPADSTSQVLPHMVSEIERVQAIGSLRRSTPEPLPLDLTIRLLRPEATHP